MYPIYDISPSTITDLRQQHETPVEIKFSIWHTFKHHIPRFIITILVDVILPLVIYMYLQKYIKPVYALLAASSPPLFMVIFKGMWLRTFDALGFLVFVTFSITAIVAVVSRNPIILLLEKSLLTCILSLIFGVTLIPFQFCKHRCRWRPLAYYFYQDLVPTKRKDIGLPDSIFNDDEDQIDNNYAQLKEEVSNDKLSNKKEVSEVYEWLYGHCSSFRISCYFTTSVWSVGYFLEFLARVILILAGLSINKIVIYGHVILSSITVFMILSTILCITIERKYTLAFIARWRSQTLNIPQNQQRRPSEMLSSFVVVRSDSNCILSVNS
ncbi:unnamed protein product [Rotaria magnacalcarata]|uniref:Uncharacterized protein n=1 Tax=Rotaria magnacalcarata TaxID=392030 RepID=A0A815L6X0_9BILA|nr:unnamed protein product [Rotaria magnacalcarata]CAF1456834.1 unnamed protein product [Rotaria magnacalcarata]CAF2089115.1 unnamed protein product [Rotaria magnacalcarata]CAF4069060.1 unnamed protein product [Rotaria magnacalcarata]CAF4083444.1 unnamed protein product [Rotaria magnacalcarata]